MRKENRKISSPLLSFLTVCSEMYRVWKLHTMSSVMWTFENNLGFSLCAMLSVCYIITTSEDRSKSKED